MSKVLEGAPAATPTANDQPTQPSTRERIAGLNSDQRQKYELTGELPELASPSKEATPAATPEPEGEAPKPTPEAGPDKDKQEPGPQEPKRDRSLSRKDRKIGELSATLRQTQRELDDLKKVRGSNAPAPTPTDKPTQEGKPVRPEEPDITDFQTTADFKQAQKEYRTKFAAYEDARDEWNRQQWEAKQSKSAPEDDAEKQSKERIESFDKRQGDFQKTLKDFDDKTKSSKLYQEAFKEVRETLIEIQPDREVIDALLEIGPEGIYYLGSKAEELDRILELPTHRALRELGKIEAALAKAPKPNTVSKAPEPPTNLGGKDEGADGPPVGSKQWTDAENAKDARRMLGVAG